MQFLLLVCFVSVVLVARWMRLLEFRIDSLPFLIFLVAGLHGVLMVPYIGTFSNVGIGYYCAVYAVAFLSLLVGFWCSRKVGTKAFSRVSGPIPNSPPSLPLMISVVFAIGAMSAFGYFEYSRSIGTWNPLAGVKAMFSGTNMANTMWSTSGAMAWGSGRGGEGDGGIVAYVTRWWSLLPLLALSLLGRRWIIYIGFPFLLIKLLTLTAGYSSRTTMAIWIGVLFFYVNQYVRRFKMIEVGAILFFGFVMAQVLHMSRLGNIQGRDVLNVDVIASGFEGAVIDTFEPAGWCFTASDIIGRYDLGHKVSHFESYFGAAIPRIIWPSKPFYAFEPDLTMAVTLHDISGDNPVRTFTVVGEGLLMGGIVGVGALCAFYAFFSLMVEMYLTQYWCLAFVRYWWVLMAAIMFRTSLFTLFSAAFVLNVAPMILVALIIQRFVPGVRPQIAGARPLRQNIRPNWRAVSVPKRDALPPSV